MCNFFAHVFKHIWKSTGGYFPQKEFSEMTEDKKTSSWKNRERVMVLCSRGVSYRDRHLMQDFRTLLPHAKSESKLDKNQNIKIINEVCEMRNCTKCIYFECKKKKDLYLWISDTNKGPTAKFLLHNIHTMGELRLSGNCLKGSRPVLSFDDAFNTKPHLKLLKELFIQTLGTPRSHPRSQPFTDHVLNFSLTPDGRIWFRNYQIVSEDGQLEEIGPRLVMELIRVYEGSFGGEILFENPDFQNPNTIRRVAKQSLGNKYTQRVDAKKSLAERREKEPETQNVDPLEAVFETETKGTGASEDASGEEDEDTMPPESKRIKRDILNVKRNKKKKNKKSN